MKIGGHSPHCCRIDAALCTTLLQHRSIAAALQYRHSVAAASLPYCIAAPWPHRWCRAGLLRRTVVLSCTAAAQQHGATPPIASGSMPLRRSTISQPLRRIAASPTRRCRITSVPYRRAAPRCGRTSGAVPHRRAAPSCRARAAPSCPARAAPPPHRRNTADRCRIKAASPPPHRRHISAATSLPHRRNAAASQQH